MSENLNFGFVKKFRSQKSRDLKKYHPSSYLVLDTVAENAKWDNSECKLGLQKGEAIITYSACGVSPQQFETALKYLETNQFIEIIHRGRKDKNSKLLARIKPETTPDSILITSRINGTVVKLIDSSIWDVNLEQPPKLSTNQTRNNSGFTPNKEEIKEIRNKEEYILPHSAPLHAQKNFSFSSDEIQPLDKTNLVNGKLNENLSETNIGFSEILPSMQHNIDYQTITKLDKEETKSNKEKKSKTKSKQKKEKDSIPKIKFRDHVYLTQEEYNDLLELHKELLDEALDDVDCYKGSSGKNYKSDYHVLRSGGWAGKKYIKIRESNLKSSSSNNSNKNFVDENNKTSAAFFKQCRTLINVKGNFYDWNKANDSLRVGNHRNYEEISIHENPHIFKQRLESALRKYNLWVSEKIEQIPIDIESQSQNLSGLNALY